MCIDIKKTTVSWTTVAPDGGTIVITVVYMKWLSMVWFVGTSIVNEGIYSV